MRRIMANGSGACVGSRRRKRYEHHGTLLCGVKIEYK